jgi:hypothetical protein
MEAGTVAAWVAAVISLGAAATAWRYARRSVQASERSADAAERNVEIATRVRWRVDHWGGETWLLINDSTETAYAVTVIVPADLTGGSRREMRYGPADLGPDGSLEFDAAAHMGTADDKVVVTWHRRPDRSDARGEWIRKLPQRPKNAR